MGEMIRGTFFGGGPGAILVQLVLIALFAWACGAIAQALGKGQHAGLIQIAAALVGVGMVAARAFAILESILMVK